MLYLVVAILSDYVDGNDGVLGGRVEQDGLVDGLEGESGDGVRRVVYEARLLVLELEYVALEKEDLAARHAHRQRVGRLVHRQRSYLKRIIITNIYYISIINYLQSLILLTFLFPWFAITIVSGLIFGSSI